MQAWRQLPQCGTTTGWARVGVAMEGLKTSPVIHPEPGHVVNYTCISYKFVY